jgi:hypothetical protein
METIRSPKRRFELVLHGGRLSNSVSMAIQLCKPDNLRNPANGDDTFSETSVRTSVTRWKAK